MRSLVLKSLISLFSFALSLHVFAQSSPLIVNLQFLPPYSPYVSDYVTLGNAALVTISNTTSESYSIKIAVHITGDNGIEAYTNPGFMPSQEIIVGPYATRVLNGNEFQSYQDVGYTVVGIDEQQLAISGIIPDGYYTVCVQALDYTSNIPLSADEPSGCIPLNIQYLDAPLLISPLCSDTIDQTIPQNIIFNWISPPGAPLSTLYDFKLVELIPANRNPYDAMAAATTPVFFETTTNIPLLVYGPGQPPLEAGKSYAWQVTAFNPTADVFFQNGGKSEVCSFVYESNIITYINTDTTIIINNPTENVFINGNLQYYYASDNTSASIKNLLFTGNDKSESNDDKSNINNSPFQSENPTSQSKNESSTSEIIYPFSNEPVRLVTKYMLKYNGGKDSVYLPYNTTGLNETDNDQVISYAVTNAQGDFSFAILNGLPETGKIESNITVTIPDENLIDHYFNVGNTPGNFDMDVFDNWGFGGFGNEPDNGYTFSTAQNNYSIENNNEINQNTNDFTPDNTFTVNGNQSNSNTSTVNYTGSTSDNTAGTFTGDLYRVIQVFVNNAYYCMPDESFRNISDSTSTYIGILKTRVRDYHLHVNLSTMYDEGITNYSNTGGGASIPLNNNNNNGTTTTIDMSGGFNPSYFATDNEYYYFEDEDNDGEFTSQLNFDFTESGTQSFQATGGVYRYSIYREIIPEALPNIEGMHLESDQELLNMDGIEVFDADVSMYNPDAPKDYSAGRTLVSRVETANGNADFYKLVKSLDEGDYYILVIEPVDDLYLNPAVEIKFRYAYDDFLSEDKAIYSNDYETPDVELQETENTVLSSTAVISGKIDYKYNDPLVPEKFPLKNVNITLQRLQYVITDEGEKKYSRYRTDLITTSTDAQGNYLFNYTDTAAYGLIAMEGSITGMDNCSFDIPDEQNPDIPGMDEMIPGNINIQIINQMKLDDDDLPDMNIPSGYGKSFHHKNYLLNIPTAPDNVSLPCIYTGKLYQELAIKVESEYYTSPDKHFTIYPAQYKEMEDLLAYVRCYDLNLTVNSDQTSVQYIPKGTKARDLFVVLLRENRPDDVPENEVVVSGIDNSAIAQFILSAEKLGDFTGTSLQVNLDGSSVENDSEFLTEEDALDLNPTIDGDDNSGFHYGGINDWDIVNMNEQELTINESDILACGRINAEGKITFKNLVKNIGSSDNYQLLVIPDYGNSDVNYLIPLHTFKTDFILENTVHPYGSVSFPYSAFAVSEGICAKMSVNYTMGAIPQEPVLFGKVLRSDNGYPLLDADVSLYDNPDGILEAQTKTASDGTYSFVITKEQYNANDSVLFERQLVFSKYGYDENKTDDIISLKKGMISNRVADTLQPAVLVSGYIYTEYWDEEDQTYFSAPSFVQIGNGPQVHTDCKDNDLEISPGILDGYLEEQGVGDITTYIPNYEEMWEQNIWDPSIQVFGTENEITNDLNVSLNGSIDLFDGGTNTTNRSGSGTDINISLNDGLSGSSGSEITSGISNINENNCELAFYATFASRGTWLAEINPDSSEYFTKYENVYIPEEEDVLRLDFMVYKKLHRMHFIVTDAEGNPVNATIEIVGITDLLETGADGIRDIVFENSGTDFTVLINGAGESDLIQKELSITNYETASLQTYTATLNKGVTISGKVTSGTTNISGARVFVDVSGLEYLEAYTDASGNYSLNGIPKLPVITLRAVKESSAYIGSVKYLSTDIVGYTIPNTNFNLTEYTAMDISKLVGFKTEIEALYVSGGITYISGNLVDIEENNNFSADEIILPFTGIKIKASTEKNASGIPYAEPMDASISISNTEAIQLMVFDRYQAEAASAAGSCIIEKLSPTSGIVKAPVKILETSFTDAAFNFSGYGVTGFYLTNYSGMYLDGSPAPPIIGHEKITLFSSVSENEPDNNFYTIETGSKLIFNIQNVAAYIQNETSNRVYEDSVVFDTWLDPEINYTEGLSEPLNIGNIHITPDDISTKTGTTPFSINLNKWDINCTAWSLTNDGFQLTDGELDASGVNFGFTEMKIENGELVFETSTVLSKSSVNLIDILTMNIENDPDLIYNGANWQIFVSGNEINPAATISNVPGLPVSDNDLAMEILLFYSNADAEFKMSSNTFELYKVTDFTTSEGALYVHNNQSTGESYLTLPGIIDLHLPAISVQPTAFIIKNNNGSISTELQPFGFGMEVNGITAEFNAGDIEFMDDGLIVNGTVSEDPYFNHDVKLFHLEDSTAINTIPGEIFQYTSSGQNLTNLFGRMYPQNNEWTNYQFTGDVSGAEKTSGRWTFTVYGEITAENQKADVDDLKMEGGANSAMDFDNMGMSYDFENRRLVGSVTIDESMPGGGSISGQASCVYDDAGWYFACGGQITMPSNPYVTDVSLALVFGDYPIKDEQAVKDIFTEYSFDGSLPDSLFDYITGFYFDGKIEMPIPYVPNFDVDLVVVDAEFEAGITAGFQLGMNFTAEQNTYYTGLDASIEVHAGVGVSFIHGCAGVDVNLKIALGLDGMYSSNGDWNITGYAEGDFTASAYAGGGLVCDSECQGVCAYDEWAGTLYILLEGEMGSENGNDYSEAGIEEVYVSSSTN